MAAGRLPKPGTQYGPCLVACQHLDCKATREMADTRCFYCGEAIGYEQSFYQQSKNELFHSACLEDEALADAIAEDAEAAE